MKQKSTPITRQEIHCHDCYSDFLKLRLAAGHEMIIKKNQQVMIMLLMSVTDSDPKYNFELFNNNKSLLP